MSEKIPTQSTEMQLSPEQQAKNANKVTLVMDTMFADAAAGELVNRDAESGEVTKVFTPEDLKNQLIGVEVDSGSDDLKMVLGMIEGGQLGQAAQERLIEYAEQLREDEPSHEEEPLEEQNEQQKAERQYIANELKTLATLESQVLNQASLLTARSGVVMAQLPSMPPAELGAPLGMLRAEAQELHNRVVALTAQLELLKQQVASEAVQAEVGELRQGLTGSERLATQAEQVSAKIEQTVAEFGNRLMTGGADTNQLGSVVSEAGRRVGALQPVARSLSASFQP